MLVFHMLSQKLGLSRCFGDVIDHHVIGAYFILRGSAKLLMCIWCQPVFKSCVKVFGYLESHQLFSGNGLDGIDPIRGTSQLPALSKLANRVEIDIQPPPLIPRAAAFSQVKKLL